MHIVIDMWRKTFLASWICKTLEEKKEKKDVLLLLDSIVYARLDIDYNEAFEKLVRFNDNLEKWVVENNPEHWAMPKFL